MRPRIEPGAQRRACVSPAVLGALEISRQLKRAVGEWLLEMTAACTNPRRLIFLQFSGDEEPTNRPTLHGASHRPARKNLGALHRLGCLLHFVDQVVEITTCTHCPYDRNNRPNTRSNTANQEYGLPSSSRKEEVMKR